VENGNNPDGAATNRRPAHDTFAECLEAERRENPGLAEADLKLRALARMNARIGRRP